MSQLVEPSEIQLILDLLRTSETHEALVEANLRIAGLEAEVERLTKQSVEDANTFNQHHEDMLKELAAYTTAELNHPTTWPMIERQGNRIKELEKQLAEAQADAERLLVLATKWCDKDHQDWQEILRFSALREGE